MAPAPRASVSSSSGTRHCGVSPPAAVAILLIATALGGCDAPRDGTRGGRATPSSPAEGQSGASGGSILGVTLAADLGDDGTTTVSVEYRLETADPLAPIPLRGLAYDGRVPEDVVVTYGGDAAEIAWLPAELPALRGRVTPGSAAEPADAATVERSLTLRYRIGPGSDSPTGGDVTLDARLPVILVDWPPVAAPEGFFQASISIPSGMAIVERFPTVPLLPAPAAAGEDILQMSLPAVPSVLRFRLASGASGPGFATWVDLAVVALLLLLSAIAWRALRASERA